MKNSECSDETKKEQLNQLKNSILASLTDTWSWGSAIMRDQMIEQANDIRQEILANLGVPVDLKIVLQKFGTSLAELKASQKRLLESYGFSDSFDI